MKLQTKRTGLPNDPLEVFSRLAGEHDYCFLLETLADKYQPQTSGQSYIGLAPKRRFAAKEDQFYINGKVRTSGNPYDGLRKQLIKDRTLPGGYVGGFVGYFSHEAISYSEPTLKFPYARDFFDFEFAEYDDGLVFKKDKAPRYFYYGEDRSSLYAAKGGKRGGLKISSGPARKNTVEYTEMIDKARTDIQNGRVFQVVLANRYEYGFEGDLVDLYAELRRINPSPFMFFIKFGNVVTLGASPELLVHTNSQD